MMKQTLKQILALPIIFMLVLSMNNAQATIKANQKSSSVKFAGEHAGMKFQGVFKRWQATLVLPPAATPAISATFYLDSAKTGDSIYDSTLSEFDWFDVEHHPKGNFNSTKIVATEHGYNVTGDLTIKKITNPVTFVLTEKGNTLSANFNIDRLAYEIGLESDPDAEWVSQNIEMSMKIEK
jgi:polyisoprenoid-binding protein YceI